MRIIKKIITFLRQLKIAIVEGYLDGNRFGFYLFLVILVIFHTPTWLGIILTFKKHNLWHLTYSLAWFWIWDITTSNKINDFAIAVFLTNLTIKLTKIAINDIKKFIKQQIGD